MQVEALRWACLQLSMHSISNQTVLEYAQLADTLLDTTLMDACILYLTESDQGYALEIAPLCTFKLDCGDGID